MKKLLIAAAVVIVGGVGTAHWYYSDRGRFTTEPEFEGLTRTVAGNDIVSDSDPAAIVRFDPAFRYVGGQKFILYGVADTEQYFFVETDADNVLVSLYWVQFEAYLPDNSYSYNYESSPGRLQLGEFDFYVDTAIIESDPTARRRGTDGGLTRQFLASKGYSFPKDFAYARLVHLTDETRRKELMIIFIEDLAPQGLTAADLAEGGSDEGRLAEIETRLLERIRNTLAVLQPQV